MKRSPRLTEAQKALILRYLEQGYTLASISNAVGCHVNTVSRHNQIRKRNLAPLLGGVA